MKKIFPALGAALILAVSCSAPESTSAQQALKEPTKVVKLYPEGQDVDLGIVEDGVSITLGPGVSSGLDSLEFFWEADGSLNYVSDSARLEIYLPEKRNGQMIIMCPGGGYRELSKRGEGDHVAQVLTEKGYSVAVLCYRLPLRHESIPLTDAQNAFRYCRYHASEWGIRQIGVMGGSAGGHLAATVSTKYVDSLTRPDFAVLLYPVISSDPDIIHGATFRNLTGRDEARFEIYSAEKNVTPDTPPTALYHSSNDKTVKVENSIRYYLALREAGVTAQLQIYPTGGHGWGFNTMQTAGRDKLGAYRESFFDSLYAFLEMVREQ